MGWQIFYLIEPWGWEDQEYRTAALLTMMHNTHIQKRNQAKKLTSFIRDLPGAVVKYLERKETEKERPDLTTEEGRRQATAEILKGFSAMFGGRLIRKK